MFPYIPLWSIIQENFLGLIKGTSAPADKAISLIFNESVETRTCLFLQPKACSIDQVISGFPSNKRSFTY